MPREKEQKVHPIASSSLRRTDNTLEGRQCVGVLLKQFSQAPPMRHRACQRSGGRRRRKHRHMVLHSSTNQRQVQYGVEQLCHQQLLLRLLRLLQLCCQVLLRL